MKKDKHTLAQLEASIVQSDVCCYAQQGDVHTACGKAKRISRYVEQRYFVTCPQCLLALGMKVKAA